MLWVYCPIFSFLRFPTEHNDNFCPPQQENPDPTATLSYAIFTIIALYLSRALFFKLVAIPLDMLFYCSVVVCLFNYRAWRNPDLCLETFVLQSKLQTKASWRGWSIDPPEDKCSNGQVSNIFSLLVSRISHPGEALWLSVQNNKNGTVFPASGRCHMLLGQAKK